MKMTTEELRDMVTTSVLRYLVEVRGGVTVDEGVTLIKWAEAQDFEFQLESLREE